MAPKLLPSAWILLGGLALSWGLVVLILAGHLADISSMATRVLYGGIATIALSVPAAIISILGAPSRTVDDAADASTGVIIGLVAGCAWILEIGFNNFVDHRVATGPARFVVDDSVWGLIALLILAASSVRSLRTGRFTSGLRVGLWSGLVSGLISCLTGLLLVIACLPCLLRDPLNIQEYAVRGADEHATDMATYFPYDTMAGALGHLVILGLAMGALLGVVGGLVALLPSSEQNRSIR